MYSPKGASTYLHPPPSERPTIFPIPSFGTSQQGHTLLQRITGADANALTTALATHGKITPRALSNTTEAPASPSVDLEKSPAAVETPEQLTQRLTKLMGMDKRVLFMKGNPEGPRCGFSRQFVSILKEKNVPYSYFDIYTDESVRQGEPPYA